MTVFGRDLPLSFGEALRVCREILSANHELIRKGSIDAEAEQLVIGAHRFATGEKLSRVEFFSRLQDRIPENSAERVLVYAGMRREGKLLQHILGFQVFLGHEYQVNNSTLIPRPETEVLVDETIRRLKHPAKGLEIGLGSGVISIELLNAFPHLRMIATESSTEAAQLASENAKRILGEKDSSRLEIRKTAASDVLEPFGGVTADFIVSNPPYLEPSETESEVLEHEPRSALFPEGGDPLFFYRRIAEAGRSFLKTGGKVFLEIASERATETAELFEEHWRVQLLPDLTGKPRVLIAEPRG